ncbi:hypothetical protein H310_14246 [Aphanomyces invadans]|uniref:ubiquitinyl hydrolase 1 n=1 Tax=Aphanomyces invadans TaxID=157072 RepID=A0A024TAL3_9STRA|nr:hypothetical protein H310_14246 [Aphanomyces invadans]ETV91083.1 hypothetical protein H310_14246 [Aphanomyces invadans]|eukprot:XP_008880279.1 hypothetical protein H310_14246 [Aphanomyces invadans]
MGLDPVAQVEGNEDAAMLRCNQASEMWRMKLRAHDSVDAQNPFGTWCSAQVVEATPQSVVIRYHGMNSHWDERLPRDSARLASSSTHARNDNLPIALGTPVHVFDNSSWREAHVTCVCVDHVRVLPTDSPTEVWLPFTPHSITPSEKQRTRRILHSNSCFEHYVHALRQINMRLFAVDGDGNCLFRAVSHQLYGDDRHHGIVRRFCMDYMELQQSFFEPFIVGDMTAFQRYVRYKRQDAVWGDDPELQAICELYDRPAQVFAYDASAGAKRLRVFHDTQTRPPICLSFYGGGHYDSVVGPSHRANLLADEPGAYEARKIALAQHKQWSDEEASVLELSRKEFGGSTMTLEAALAASCEAYDAEVAKRIDVAAIETVRAESELHQLQNEMLQCVAKQSEEELLQAALEASMDPYQDELEVALALSTNGMDAYAIDAFDEEEAEMQRAIQMSMLQ